MIWGYHNFWFNTHIYLQKNNPMEKSTVKNHGSVAMKIPDSSHGSWVMGMGHGYMNSIRSQVGWIRRQGADQRTQLSFRGKVLRKMNHVRFRFLVTFSNDGMLFQNQPFSKFQLFVVQIFSHNCFGRKMFEAYDSKPLQGVFAPWIFVVLLPNTKRPQGHKNQLGEFRGHFF